jgi:hypothetical protein
LRVWKASRVPDAHIFSGSVFAMFVEKKLESGAYEGFLICLKEDHFMTHPNIIFHDSRNQKFMMSLKNIRTEDEDSPTLFYLFLK